MTAAPRQIDLFAEEPPVVEYDFHTPVPRHEPFRHTKESIRGLLTGLIAELKTQDELQWDADTLRSNRAMAPYMAEWLKGGEGDQLLSEFRAELERLGQDPIHRRELYAPIPD